MKITLPRKRTILAWHRWLGFASACFLVILSLTGLALNHTEWLKLDQITLRNRLLLERYGMASGSNIQAYRINNDDLLAHLDGQLFYNSTPLTQGTQPLGILSGDPISVVATASQLIYLSTDGQLIETISNNQLPYNTLTALGTDIDGNAVLISADGNWRPDPNWLEFNAYDAAYQVTPLSLLQLSQQQSDDILADFQGGGISLYRALLDLHSGRLFGWAGRSAMDLSAIAILLLITSGIGGWFRRSRQKTISPN